MVWTVEVERGGSGEDAEPVEMLPPDALQRMLAADAEIDLSE